MIRALKAGRVIGPTGAVRVMVATRPVDFRKGAEGLAALVRETMGADPFSGAVYVFRAKRADRVKLIFWDGTGVCLFAKRLEEGRFSWPRIEDGIVLAQTTVDQFRSDMPDLFDEVLLVRDFDPSAQPRSAAAGWRRNGPRPRAASISRVTLQH